MQIYAGTDIRGLGMNNQQNDYTEQMFRKLIGKDLWVFCATEFGTYYIQPVKLENHICTYRCVSRLNRDKYPEDASLSSMAMYHQLDISYFEVITPVQVYTTEEIIEPICAAQGLPLDETLGWWKG